MRHCVFAEGEKRHPQPEEDVPIQGGHAAAIVVQSFDHYPSRVLWCHPSLDERNSEACAFDISHGVGSFNTVLHDETEQVAGAAHSRTPIRIEVVRHGVCDRSYELAVVVTHVGGVKRPRQEVSTGSTVCSHHQLERVAINTGASENTTKV